MIHREPKAGEPMATSARGKSVVGPIGARFGFPFAQVSGCPGAARFLPTQNLANYLHSVVFPAASQLRMADAPVGASSGRLVSRQGGCGRSDVVISGACRAVSCHEATASQVDTPCPRRMLVHPHTFPRGASTPDGRHPAAVVWRGAFALASLGQRAQQDMPDAVAGHSAMACAAQVGRCVRSLRVEGHVRICPAWGFDRDGRHGRRC